MCFNWITGDGVNIIAIVGISKNAGKTSLLNHLLRMCPHTSMAVFSTGLDGEEEDSVFRTPKPAVTLPADTIFCCDSRTLDEKGGTVEVLASIPDIQRPLWIARSRFQIQTRITGPATVADQIQLSRQMQSLGAKKIIIDGSLDRKSITLSPAIDAIALVLGASFGNVQEVTTELDRLLMLGNIKLYPAINEEYELLSETEEVLFYKDNTWQSTEIKTFFGNETLISTLIKSLPKSSRIFIPGVLSKHSLPLLKDVFAMQETHIILRHPDCLKIDLPDLKALHERCRLLTLIPFRIKAVALNAEAIGAASADAAHFRSHIRTAFPQLNIIDVMEVEHA
ncbi:MAG: hypothetical protein GX294_08430 [Candidatus Cloacimonetes bacterium]|nr:hypothetical protein [Candidatus Cloacimonadota bacterium]